ncbi:hypothetical protein TNCT_32421 [Trichonephila clavata]|uniref:C2H2-type domain-containing protein n=1 Tax=Trichonephila clavata TaxID=2740835 RepID=A0A8X6GA03_TRICU|nr:hypothetical protein TNCT_32421 [Trichonephila clavata]
MGLNEIVNKLKEGVSCQSTDSSQSMSPTDCTAYPEIDSKYGFTEGVTEKTPFLCSYCNKAFTKRNLLKRHELVSSCSPFLFFMNWSVHFRKRPNLTPVRNP